MTMNGCIFCKIIAREIPGEIVFENDAVLAFLDIQPVNPGHTLVIPKEHASSLAEAALPSLNAVIDIIPTLGEAIKRATGAPAYHLAVNNGPEAGQVVMHTHFHIIPRHANDGYKSWTHRSYEDGEAASVANKIREALM